MDTGGPLNMIIAGVGGQGVNALTRVFRELCERHDIYSTGSVHKGGAQRMGSVHAELRLFTTETDDCDMYSTEIPRGDLGVLLGLDPWEALRHRESVGEDTVLIVNSRREPFFLERTEGFDAGDPWELIDALGVKTVVGDYTAEAVSTFGVVRMANYLMGREATRSGLLPFGVDEYDDVFIDTLDLPDEIVGSIRSLA